MVGRRGQRVHHRAAGQRVEQQGDRRIFPPITAAVAAAGYAGDIEVEIFNEAAWSAPPDETAARLRATFPEAFSPGL